MSSDEIGAEESEKGEESFCEVAISRLVEAFGVVSGKEELASFLRDLMTESEISELSNRLRAAKMLDEKIPYATIEKETGLSSATIARVSKWLQKGKGGYRLVLDRLGSDPVKSESGGYESQC